MDNKEKENRIIELRKSTGMTRKAFCTYFGIPYRTMTDWELGNRHMPEYLLRLMAYKVKTERLDTDGDKTSEYADMNKKIGPESGSTDEEIGPESVGTDKEIGPKSVGTDEEIGPEPVSTNEEAGPVKEDVCREKDPQIICVGDLCCDLIVPYGRMRETLSSGDISAKNAENLLVTMRCGGSVGNVARHLGLMKKIPIFLSSLKNDELGKYLAEEMKEAGVNMRWTSLSERSNMYCIAVLDESGERTMFSFVPPWADYPRFNENSFTAVPRFSSTILFTSGMAILDDKENNTAVLDFFSRRKEEGACIVFDLNVRAESYGYEGERRRAMEEVISVSDIVLGSGKEEFQQVTGTDDFKEAASRIMHMMDGPAGFSEIDRGRKAADGGRHEDILLEGITGKESTRAVIARDGGNPIYILEKTTGKKEEGTYVDVKPVKPVSTLGAGDCFDAAFLNAITRGADMADAVRQASDYAGAYISGDLSKTGR